MHHGDPMNLQRPYTKSEWVALFLCELALQHHDRVSPRVARSMATAAMARFHDLSPAEACHLWQVERLSPRAPQAVTGEANRRVVSPVDADPRRAGAQ